MEMSSISINKDDLDLGIAVWTGNLDRVRFLLDKGAKVDQTNSIGETMLMLACRSDRLEVVRELCCRGANVNYVLTDGSGLTPLIIASKMGKLDVVRELCDRGANIKAEMFNGLNSIMIAEKEGCDDIVQELCMREGGLNVYLKTMQLIYGE